MGLCKFQDFFHHFPNSIKNLMDGGIAHEGTGRHQFISLVDVYFIDMLIDVLTA